MADTTFVDQVTPVPADWINDVNDATYNGTAVFTPGLAGSVLRTQQAKLRETVSVMDFGAVCDGVTDDSAAVQLAIDYCIINIKDLEVPGMCRLGSTIYIDRPVDGANADHYFTIMSKSGGGFVITSNTVMFSNRLVNALFPTGQMIKFHLIKFEADVNTRTGFVIDSNKFLRMSFVECNFRKIRCLYAPTGYLTQSIYFINCQARRWAGTFFSSQEVCFDLAVIGGLWEAGGDAFDIRYPVGTTFTGACIEGMANYAIKYVGAQGFSVHGCYFEYNGYGQPNGTTIDGSAGVGLNGSESVSIVGNYFSGDDSQPNNAQVKWGDCVSGLSSGNISTTTLHNLTSGSRVESIAEYARTKLANQNFNRYFRVNDNQFYGGIITQEFIGGRGGLLKLRSMQNNVISATGLDIEETGDTNVTGNLRINPAASIVPNVNGEVVIQKTSNTQLTFKLKGSDGVVRSGSITLS